MTAESRRASPPQPPQWLLDAFNREHAVYAHIAWNALLSKGRVTANHMDGKLVIHELVIPLPLQGGSVAPTKPTP